MFLTFVVTVLMATGSTMAISVQCPVKRYVVILFQPVTLTCNFQTSSTQPPVITWRYKSYCRDPIQAALNPSSADNILSQNNPNYNANIECADNLRTVRIVASKQGSAVTLGLEYQGRKVSILNNADLNLAQTAWGDSGVYVCSVVSSQDLTGNSEDYTELIVLERKSNTTDLLPEIDLLVMEDWLLVVLVVFGFLLLLLLIAICWCQCCPHTCCCYISCPCCPEKCCCPRALYEAGKAVKSGIPSHYAPTLYAPSMYPQPPYGGGMQQPGIPMLPLPQGMGGPPLHPNGYGREYDRASSVGQGSEVPLLHDQDSGAGDQTRSGYRIQVDPDGNATRAIYYMERQLANLDPTRSGDAGGKYNRLDGGMSEVSSLHDDPRGRGGGRSQAPPLATVYDQDEAMSTISSVSAHGQRGRDDYPRRGGGPSPHMGAQGRARSMDNLDDIARRDRYPRDPRDPHDDYPPQRRDGGGGARDRRGSDDGFSSRGGYDRGRDFDDRRRREPSPDDRRRRGSPVSGLQGRRSRDDLMAIERDRERGGGRGGGRDAYDDSFLWEAMEKKRLGEQQRARSRERLDSDSERSDRGRAPRGPPPLPMSPPSAYPVRRYDDNYPAPPPPPYISDDESLTSCKKSNLRKNGAVSRESLVV
ncbi:lipolysis-stimulated lipoprotein receptor isoform X1 [Oncorhynchus mykiss]|uniref:Ig-like domain-containing protein n=2 Tax=Oncorhynchus mykiss TaxID=8022 RepID=A0A8C7S7Y3_ONCMY|nr:lipolysis-stimulated lipoprotein receptor isoform X1 [Oncorhynchus mykiss]